MKKKVCIYVAGFFLIAFTFSASYYMSYRSALNQFNKRAQEGNSMLLAKTNLNNQESTKQIAEEGDNTSVEADTVQLDKVTVSTKYIIQSYDIITGKTTELLENIPEYYIGLNRNEVIHSINQYMLDVPLEEFQEGLVSFELVSFSNQKITVKKTYNSSNIPDKYYIIVREGMVIVFYGDQKTVYEYTGIAAEELSQEDQRKLNYGISVKDDEELYGILENFSS